MGFNSVGLRGARDIAASRTQSINNVRLSPYDAGKNYSDSWALANQTIRRRAMLAARSMPEDQQEQRFLDWEVR